MVVRWGGKSQYCQFNSSAAHWILLRARQIDGYIGLLFKAGYGRHVGEFAIEVVPLADEPFAIKATPFSGAHHVTCSGRWLCEKTPNGSSILEERQDHLVGFLMGREAPAGIPVGRAPRRIFGRGLPHQEKLEFDLGDGEKGGSDQG